MATLTQPTQRRGKSVHSPYSNLDEQGPGQARVVNVEDQDERDFVENMQQQQHGHMASSKLSRDRDRDRDQPYNGLPLSAGGAKVGQELKA